MSRAPLERSSESSWSLNPLQSPWPILSANSAHQPPRTLPPSGSPSQPESHHRAPSPPYHPPACFLSSSLGAHVPIQNRLLLIVAYHASLSILIEIFLPRNLVCGASVQFDYCLRSSTDIRKTKCILRPEPS